MYKCIIINYNIIHIHSIIAQQRLASATWVQSSRDSSVRLNFGILKLGCFITINIKKKNTETRFPLPANGSTKDFILYYYRIVSRLLNAYIEWVAE